MFFHFTFKRFTLSFFWVNFITVLSLVYYATSTNGESQRQGKVKNIDNDDLNSLSLISSVSSSDSSSDSTSKVNSRENSLHENLSGNSNDDGVNMNKLKYVWGDALDDPMALGPDGKPYPWEMASQFVSKQRNPRSFMFTDEKTEPHLISPQETRKILLSAYEAGDPVSALNYQRQGRSKKVSEPQGCVPARLCQSTYNTTAPLYGVSLTSGRPVTIVQKFPDLLQQVVFQVCRSSECSVIHGQCVQTYLPYLFLVIPLGPVTLTGQDYVLVESGCVCQPKYAKKHDDPPPLPFIQAFSSTNTSKN